MKSLTYVQLIQNLCQVWAVLIVAELFTKVKAEGDALAWICVFLL